MTIHQIECFCALAKYNNFTRAADSLYLSQPAFSRAVRALEEEVGMSLFVRDKSQPRLTEAGEKIFPHMEAILSEYSQICKVSRTCAKAGEEPEGTIVLGVYRLGLLRFLPGMIAGYKQLHPRIHFDMAEHTGVSIFPALKSCDVDLTHTNYIPENYKKCLNVLEIERYSHKVLLPLNHPLAGEESVALEDLASERFVTLDRRQFPLINSRLVGLCANAGFSPNVLREFDNFTNMFDYISEGKAVAVMAMPDPHHSGIVAVPVKDIDLDPSYLVWSSANEKPELLDFIKFIKSKLQQN